VTEDRDGVTESVTPTVTTVTPDRDDRGASVTVDRDGSVTHRDATLQKAPSNAVSDSVTAVDLVTLRRDIADWVKLHHEVDRLRTGREPYNPRMLFFLVGVAFFVLLAYSAAVPA
jgi:hypothetical protein